MRRRAAADADRMFASAVVAELVVVTTAAAEMFAMSDTGAAAAGE